MKTTVPIHAGDIPDNGLRHAILDALLDLGHLNKEALGARLANIRDPEVEDPWEHEDAWIAEALGRLEMVELDPAHLAAIERINFDGGNDIYLLIEGTLDIDTGGETDHYQLGSLVGIDRLPALQSLNLDGHGYRKEAIDLAPLRNHSSLRRVRLSGKCIHAQVLEHLPALTSIDVRLGSVDDDAVLDRLEARGIEVRRRR